ncbi:histidine-specific methyltransferase [Aspergillus alliaceus]|uniref:4-dimethylallyltryptophan N-methyltransferase n=1 Tax=Petromyces alliaceus TaxID=209559 RepID=A0A5N7BTF0_PETAA|nr:histidine-specific methyltransferase [Aspergillus alliaceus]
MTVTTTTVVFPSEGSGNIIDIGTGSANDTVETQQKQMLQQRLLKKENGKRWLPTALVWGDENAHRLWWEANTLDEFYSIRDEINLLKVWAQDIARQVQDHSVIIDLGCGDVTKVVPLLNELERNGKHVHYYALDISRKALENVLAKLPTSYQYVKYTGLWGTFDNLRAWCGNIQEPRWFLSLGSIFGNDEFQIAINDLKKWVSVMRPQDRMLLGLDACDDDEKVWRSYNDVKDCWHRMIRNGLALSNKVLGHEWYRPEDWEVIGVCHRRSPTLTHQWVARATRTVHCEPLGLYLAQGEEIVTNEWYKYGPDEMQKQFDAVGLSNVAQWKSPSGPVCK